MNARDWIDAFAAQLGVDAPSDETVEMLLSLAGDAAHASERTAAPITCYLVGRSGVDLAAAIEAARAITD